MPIRQDFEPQESFDARTKIYQDAQPKADNPAATIPSAIPVEAPKSELEVMTEEETAGREAAFEAEKVVQPIKVEETVSKEVTPPPSASDNIEVLG